MNTLLLLLAAVLTAQTTDSSPHRPVRFLVAAVTPADQTADQTIDPWLGTAVERGLTWYLRRTGVTEAVPISWRDRTISSLDQPPPASAGQPHHAKHLAALLGADIVVTGSCSSGPEQLAAELQLHDLRTGQAHDCHAAGKNVSELLSRLAKQVLVTSGIVLDESAAGRIDTPICASPSAIEYHAKAMLAYRAGRHDQARYFCGQALRHDSKYRNPRITLAMYRAARGDVAGAVDSLQAVVRQAQRANDQIDVARAQGNIGLLYRRIGQNKIAQRYLDLTAKTARQDGDVYTLATVLNNLAQLQLAQNQPQAALDLLQQRQELLTKMGDRSAAGPNLTVIGTIHEQLGHFQQALKTHHQAVDRMRTIGAKSALAVALHHLGLAYHNLNRFDSAVQYYTESIELSDPVRTIATYNNLGLIYQQQRKYPQALDAFRRALSNMPDSPDPHQKAVCLANIASVLEELGQYPQAIDALQQTLEILRAVGHPQASVYQEKIDNLRAKITPTTSQPGLPR